MKKAILFTCFLMLLHTPVFAQTQLHIVRGQDFPPYHYFDPSGKEKGFIIEIIQAVTHEMGMTAKFHQYPWSRCLHMVETGEADAMMNLFKTRERTEFLYFSENVLAFEENRLFKLKGTKINYQEDLSSLTPFKIGAIRNYSYGDKFDSMAFPKIFKVETEESLIKSLTTSRCDIIIGNAIVIRALLQKSKFDNMVETMSPAVSKDPLYIGFSKAKTDKTLSDAFSNALKKFKQTPKYRTILETYLQQDPPSP